MERDPLVRGLLLLLVAISLIWLFGWLWQVLTSVSDILLLFFLAWLLAFVLDPLAQRLQQLGMPRVLAGGTVYIGLLILVAILFVSVIPTAATQLIQLGTSLPTLVTDFQQRAEEIQSYLLGRGLTETQLNDIFRELSARAQAVGTVLLSNGLAVAAAVVGTVLNFTIVLILSFYILMDGERMSRLFVNSLPVRYREEAYTALEQIDRTFGGFVRGQLIQTAIYGGGTAAIMVAAGLPFYVVIGIVAGVAMIIPVIGPYLAMAPPLILAVLFNPSAVWWVFLLLFVLQFVVVNVLMPRILGQSVGLHPVFVFAAVLIGARIGGAWGAIFGVPVAAMLYLTVRAFYQRVLKRMPLYRSGAPLSPEAFVPPVAVESPEGAAPGRDAGVPAVSGPPLRAQSGPPTPPGQEAAPPVSGR
jgi:predicted PurR-regulated permease PerM